MSSQTTNLSVTYRGSVHSLSLPQEATLADLHDRMEKLTLVPPNLQKLLYKGKKSQQRANSSEVSLVQAGLKDGIRIQMLGSTTEELGGMKAAEDENRRRERILRERALKAPVKVRNTGSSSTSMGNIKYRFHDLRPLDHLPKPETALEVLRKLSEDPAVLHVMKKHEFSVGLLTELAPHESPELLGLNVNGGQQIKLRIRTDRYDGFRNVGNIRKVLCHELAHNIWGDHDQNFKALNSLLNREVAEYERSQASGSHRLGGPGDFYEPGTDEEGNRIAEAHIHVLGGMSGDTKNETLDERRQRMLQATISRLKREEEELENTCGTTKQSG